MGEVPEGFAVGVGVLKAHLLQLAAAVQLIVPAVGLLPEVLHVDPDQHLPQLHKVAVGFIFNCIAAVGVLERKVTRSRNGQNEMGNSNSDIAFQSVYIELAILPPNWLFY